MARRWFDLLMEDHTVIEKVFAAVSTAMAQEQFPITMIRELVEFVDIYIDKCHAQKEEQHLFPLIERLGIPRHGGPLAVMLAEHEQSRELLEDIKADAKAVLAGERDAMPRLKKSFGDLSMLLTNHFWKENDILYPMAMRLMSSQDELDVINGITAIEDSLGRDTHKKYYDMAERLSAKIEDLSVNLKPDVLAAMLNMLPVELSFVDASDTVVYFSHENHDKIFPRNRGSIGMKVQDCHPAKSVHLVNRILADFKAGKRDVAEFWIDFKATKVHIRYYPVRDPGGSYLGCLEVVQDIGKLQKLEGQHVLLDEA